MYAPYKDNGTGSIIIKPAFILLATAASTFAYPTVSIDFDYNNDELQIIAQSEKRDLNPYYSVDDHTSFYDEITNGSYSDVDSLIVNSYAQLQQLSFLTIDEEVDREIDSYFAKKRMSKIKTVIYKK